LTHALSRKHDEKIYISIRVPTTEEKTKKRTTGCLVRAKGKENADLLSQGRGRKEEKKKEGQEGAAQVRTFVGGSWKENRQRRIGGRRGKKIMRFALLALYSVKGEEDSMDKREGKGGKAPLQQRGENCPNSGR